MSSSAFAYNQSLIKKNQKLKKKQQTDKQNKTCIRHKTVLSWQFTVFI